MSSKAFGLTAYYDSTIAHWFNNKLDIKFPNKKTIFGKKLEQYDMAKIHINKARFM